MELTVRKEDLVKGLGKSQSVVERRTSMPILSNVLLEAEDESLTVSATDLETSFQGHCAARVSKPGKVTVPARKLYEIVKELPAEEIYLKEKENNYLHITAGRASFNLVGLSAEDFPNLPDVEGIPELSVSGQMLAEMVEKTIFSISQEDTRFNLAGLYIQKRNRDGADYLRFVSTDGHRLSLVDRSLEGLEGFALDGGVIIPRKGVAEMRKMAEDAETISLGLNQSYASLSLGGARLVLRMQEGSFPDYEVVIPKVSKKNVVVNRQAFSEVLRRVAILATDRFQGVKLDFKEGLLEVVSQNPDLGEAREALEVDYDGDALSVGFNARYFLDLCGAMKSEEITLGFVDEQHPCLIKGEADEGFLSVIMPMRL
ncbi:MAG: DNA polymerase III subunit beta [Proteobacteria bacterium]|nr:DNA polymerase III subunit beta [Pseudomonadota bacterium]MCG2766463.1 DNA polymerase III subunit beta [Desulfarculaceae bacterium]